MASSRVPLMNIFKVGRYWSLCLGVYSKCLLWFVISSSVGGRGLEVTELMEIKHVYHIISFKNYLEIPMEFGGNLHLQAKVHNLCCGDWSVVKVKASSGNKGHGWPSKNTMFLRFPRSLIGKNRMSTLSWRPILQILAGIITHVWPGWCWKQDCLLSVRPTFWKVWKSPERGKRVNG